MRKLNSSRYGIALALALGLVTLLAACEQGAKSGLPSQPEARNFESPETSIVSADFTCSSGGEDGLTIIFVNTSTGSIDTFSWTFGDGKKSTAENPIHTYSSAGEYVVVLTVSNAISSDSIAKFCTAGVVAEPPSEEAPVGEGEGG